MQAFHEHNESAKTAAIVAELLAGKNIALISDAGTPLISDPGFVLVSEAKNAGVIVCPIPTVLSVSIALNDISSRFPIGVATIYKGIIKCLV
jgi:16S rRNA (cytidine1402-2'-O)-methyltransferase